jgi:hypothetical protein
MIIRITAPLEQSSQRNPVQEGNAAGLQASVTSDPQINEVVRGWEFRVTRELRPFAGSRDRFPYSTSNLLGIEVTMFVWQAFSNKYFSPTRCLEQQTEMRRSAQVEMYFGKRTKGR